MNSLAVLGAAIGLLMFIPLIFKVWHKKVTQNFATFLFWGALNLIAAVSIYKNRGNFVLPAMYVLGSSG